MIAPVECIGLYGGAFDPPHRTHLSLAVRFIAQAGLSRVYICPTAGAWHKARALTPAPDRLRMCQLAFAGMPQAQVDDREIRRGGASYTVDTLEELRAQHPLAKLCLLIGRDQYERLHTWRDLNRIEALATIFVADRQEPGSVELQLPGRYVLLQGSANADSATVVRERRQAGLPIDDLVTPDVARYIAEQHLYH